MSNHILQMQWVWKQYEAAGMPALPTGREVAAWALEKGLLKPKDRDVIGEWAEDLTQGQREIYRTDSDGCRYRAKQSVRSIIAGVPFARWGDTDKDDPKFIEKAFAQRRRQIVGDCYQLTLDVEHFNAFHAGRAPFQMPLDFGPDVQERKLEEGIGKKAA